MSRRVEVESSGLLGTLLDVAQGPGEEGWRSRRSVVWVVWRVSGGMRLRVWEERRGRRGC